MKNSKLKEKANRSWGFIAAMLSAVLFGAMPLLTKFVYAGGGNPISAVFYRYLVAAILLFISAKIRGVNLWFKGKVLRDLILVSLLGYGSTAFLLYSSYRFIPTSMATMIHFVYPALVILAGMLFFKEKPQGVQIVSLVLGLAGVALCFTGNASGNLAGIGLAFLSGITYAFYIQAIARSSLKELNALQVIFGLNLFSTLFILLLSPALGGIIWQMSPQGWLAALGLGLLISLLAVFLFQTGIKEIGPASASLLSTFEPLTSLVIGFLYFKEALPVQALFGSAMILAAVVLLALAPGKSKATSGV